MEGRKGEGAKKSKEKRKERKNQAAFFNRSVRNGCCPHGCKSPKGKGEKDRANFFCNGNGYKERKKKKKRLEGKKI